MSLTEFKKIFFWEYLHRIWGRLIGLTFFIPLIFIWIKEGFSKKEKKFVVTLAFLGFFQAFMGWYMVKSGLVENTTVSHYRLAIHLNLALILFSAIFWYFLNIKNGKNKTFFSFNNNFILPKIFPSINLF